MTRMSSFAIRVPVFAMRGQTTSFLHRTDSGYRLLLQILVCSTVSSNPRNAHTSTLDHYRFCVDARVQAGSPILYISKHYIQANESPKLTNILKIHHNRLRGGYIEAPSSPSCLPSMNNLVNSASARALTYVQSLRELGDAALSWFKELQRIRSYSSLQSPTKQPELKDTDAPSKEEQYMTSDARSPGSGGSDPSSALVSYDVILSCLPRGVAARRVQVCTLLQPSRSHS